MGTLLTKAQIHSLFLIQKKTKRRAFREIRRRIISSIFWKDPFFVTTLHRDLRLARYRFPNRRSNSIYCNKRISVPRPWIFFKQKILLEVFQRQRQQHMEHSAVLGLSCMFIQRHNGIVRVIIKASKSFNPPTNP